MSGKFRQFGEEGGERDETVGDDRSDGRSSGFQRRFRAPQPVTAMDRAQRPPVQAGGFRLRSDKQTLPAPPITSEGPRIRVDDRVELSDGVHETLEDQVLSYLAFATAVEARVAATPSPTIPPPMKPLTIAEEAEFLKYIIFVVVTKYQEFGIPLKEAVLDLEAIQDTENFTTMCTIFLQELTENIAHFLDGKAVQKNDDKIMRTVARQILEHIAGYFDDTRQTVNLNDPKRAIFDEIVQQVTKLEISLSLEALSEDPYYQLFKLNSLVGICEKLGLPVLCT